MADSTTRRVVRPEFTSQTNLSCKQVGGRVLFSTNEWFAAANNMLKLEQPIFEQGVFTEFGQKMDGWESQRKRVAGYDWCIIELGIPGEIHGFEVSTAFFTGNYAPKISIQAANNITIPRGLRQWQSEAGLVAQPDDFAAVDELHSENWDVIVPKTTLRPGYKNECDHYFTVTGERQYTHLRVNIYPDGGIARLHCYGDVVVDLNLDDGAEMDLVSTHVGGCAIAWSDTHYGHPKNLTNPGRGINMGDGWETARKSDRPECLVVDSNGHLDYGPKGYEWCVLQLGVPGYIDEISIDTLHFRGNYPESFEMDYCCAPFQERTSQGMSTSQVATFAEWKPLIHRKKLRPHERKSFKPCEDNLVATHVRVKIYPDGGLSRVRVFGRPDPETYSRFNKSKI